MGAKRPTRKDGKFEGVSALVYVDKRCIFGQKSECPVIRFGRSFSSRHKALSMLKMCALKCLQNGCPQFGDHSALVCALLEHFLVRPKIGRPRMQILGRFLLQRWLKLAAPFLGEKLTFWGCNSSGKKIKTRICSAAGKGGRDGLDFFANLERRNNFLRCNVAN